MSGSLSRCVVQSRAGLAPLLLCAVLLAGVSTACTPAASSPQPATPAAAPDATPDVSPATPTDSQAGEHKVGEMVPVDDLGDQFGVASGAIFDNRKGIAVKVFLDGTYFEDSTLEIRDASGDLVTPRDTMPDKRPNLDLTEGGIGWIGFDSSDTIPDDPTIWDDLALVYTDASADPPVVTEVSLRGLAALPAKNPVTKAYSAFRADEAAEEAQLDAESVDMREYKKVRRGMTLKQVNKLVGFRGDETSSYSGYKSYSWQNTDGSNMLVTFHGGRVQSKAQAGL